jgi:hypothetical protein
MWYFNGIPVSSCAACSTLTATKPGQYVVVIDGSCGTQYSLPLDVISTCNDPLFDRAHAAGAIFQGPNTINSSTVPGHRFGSLILVQSGATLDITGTQVEMMACTQIIVEPGGILNITNSTLYGCEQWAGITVLANGSSRGVVNITNSDINDAVIAVHSPDGGQINSTNSDYENNVTHIAMFNYAGNPHGSVLSLNRFGHLSTSPPACMNPATFSKPSFYKMVYLQDVEGVLISDNGFAGHPGLGNPVDKTAIHLKNVTDVDITSGNVFKAELTNAIDVENSGGVTIDGNDFNGNIVNGLLAVNSPRMMVSHNIFGKSTGSNLVNGAVIRDCEELTADRNDFYHLDNGLQYYMSSNVSTPTRIERNRFNSCAAGLVIAPLEHPLVSTTAANNTYIQNLQIFCNRFEDNGAGIIGAGDIPDQGNSTNESENEFTSNNDWDIVWDPMSPAAEIYHHVLPGTSAINAIPGPTYVLNGMSSLTNGNVFTYAASLGTICRGSWKTGPTTSIENAEIKWNAVVYPNPSAGELNIKLSTEAGEEYNATMFDILGRKVMSETFIALQGENVIRLKGDMLKKGIYILHLKSDRHSGSFRVIMNTGNAE